MFRHKRRMELVELSGRTTGRLGYTRRPEPTPSEGQRSWHTDALSSPQPPPPALSLRDDCGPPGLLGMGTAAASAGAAGPSEGIRARWSSGRTEAGVHRGERLTHHRERADDRDSEPDYLLFRHERRMELVELSGRITGRLGYTCRPEPTPSEGRQSWHYHTLSSPHLPPPALVLWDDCGPPGAVGDGHRRRFSRGRRTF